MRQFPEALKCLDRALELKPDLAEAWSNKGAALAELRQSQEALECYNRALELKPDYALAWLNKGLALYSLKRYEEAKSALEQAARRGNSQARRLLQRLRF